MSEPARSAPSPWLLFGVALASSFLVPIVGISVTSGEHKEKVRTMEARQDKLEDRVSAVIQAQASASRETGEVKTELNAVRAEMTRLANAVERLADRK